MRCLAYYTRKYRHLPNFYKIPSQVNADIEKALPIKKKNVLANGGSTLPCCAHRRLSLSSWLLPQLWSMTSFSDIGWRRVDMAHRRMFALFTSAWQEDEEPERRGATSRSTLRRRGWRFGTWKLRCVRTAASTCLSGWCTAAPIRARVDRNQTCANAGTVSKI